MIILGLSLGHDASATVLRNGKIVAHVLRERHSRIRHHLGIDRASIEQALRIAGIQAGDIATVAVAATQQIPFVVDDADFLSLSEDRNRLVGIEDFRLIDNPYWIDAKDRLFVGKSERDNNPPAHAVEYLRQCERTRRIPMSAHNKWAIYEALSPLYGPTEWLERYKLCQSEDKMSQFIATLSRGVPQDFSFPIIVELDRKVIPGWFVNHHMAHAASSYYSSPFSKALIFTHDGGTGIDSGFVFYGEDGHITGVGPHYLECGQFYDYAAMRLQLGVLGGAGKLMGLAPYGCGRLDGIVPAGTRVDWDEWCALRCQGRAFDSYQEMVDALEFAGGRSLPGGKWDAENISVGLAPELAHAVQHVLQTSISSSILHAAQAFRMSSLEQAAENLCISGGVALNCPTNSAIWNSGKFMAMHIEPHCEDGGLSIGAAQYIHQRICSETHLADHGKVTSAYAMLGPGCQERLKDILGEYSQQLTWQDYGSDWANWAAQAIRDDRIIAVFCGGYETGPRALGHRSILANPTVCSTWQRVNRIKSRELWRPFAPAVLAEDLWQWFEGGPEASPFMLFTYSVRADKTHLLPAITHVDGSSRVQTVTMNDEPLYSILSRLKALGLPPVLLNTSFNGPGSPIFQRPQEALELLLSTELSAVVFDGLIVTKDNG